MRPTRAPWTLLATAGVSALLAALPLWYLLLRAFEGVDRFGEILLRPRTLELLATSVALTAVVGVAALVLGTGTAWLAARTTVFGRGVWAVLLVLPLAVPSFVAAFSWVSLFSGFAGFWPAALVLTLTTYPYVALPVFAALTRGEASLEEVATSLGSNRREVFRTVTLPAVWPAALAGSLLAALYTLSDFGAVAILRVDVLTRAVYNSYAATFDRTAAVVQALALVAVAVVLVVIEQRSRGRAEQWQQANVVPRQRPPIRLSPAQQVAGLAVLITVVTLALIVPAVSLTLRVREGMRDGWQLGEVLVAVPATAGVSALGALLAVALAIPVALLAARYRGTLVRLVEAGAFAGHALPGVVVGLALVAFTLTVLPAAYQSVAALAFAYAVLFLPKSIGSARSAIGQVPPSLEDVARSNGRGPLASFFGVTGRLAGPGIMAGGLLVMITAMKELPATLMLRPTGLETLATRMWSYTEVAAFGAAAPYAIALVLLAAIPTFALARRMQRLTL